MAIDGNHSNAGLPPLPLFRSPALSSTSDSSPSRTTAKVNIPETTTSTSSIQNTSNSKSTDRQKASESNNSPNLTRPRTDSFFGGPPAELDHEEPSSDPMHESPIELTQKVPVSSHQPVQGPTVPTVNLHNHHQHDQVPYHGHHAFPGDGLHENVQVEAFLPSPDLDQPLTRPSSFYGLDRHAPGPSSALTETNSPASFAYSPDSDRRRESSSLRTRSLLPPSQYPTSNTRTPPGASSRMSTYRHSTFPGAVDGYLQPAGPLLDHSHLKPGAKAKLLNHAKTLELYRANAKKTNDVEVIFEFACFLMDLVKEMNEEDDDGRSINSQTDDASPTESKSSGRGSRNAGSERDKEKAALTQESIGLLQKLANRGHVQSQYLLADCYTKAIGTGGGTAGGLTVPHAGGPVKGSKQDYDRAFPLFVLAAKHGHVEAMYRAGQCCEHGWGTRKEGDKALQFYRKAAIAQYPFAMYRLGLADLNGDLGQSRRPKDGVKWLKRAAETADASNPKPLHELALLHERGIEHVVFVDFDYAVELLARAAELGYAPSAYKLGECYEYGRMGCPQDSALSIHYYNIAAQQNHKEACFALTAWYLVGSPGVLPQSDTEAYLWAKKAAESGLPKAEYAIGYFTEVGIGTIRNEREAIEWFRKAAEHGDKRAKERLKNGSSSTTGVSGTIRGNSKNDGNNSNGKDDSNNNNGKKNKEDCLVM